MDKIGCRKRPGASHEHKVNQASNMPQQECWWQKAAWAAAEGALPTGGKWPWWGLTCSSVSSSGSPAQPGHTREASKGPPRWSGNWSISQIRQGCEKRGCQSGQCALKTGRQEAVLCMQQIMQQAGGIGFNSYLCIYSPLFIVAMNYYPC